MSNQQAPHIHADGSARQMTLDVLLAAVPIMVFSAFNYGMRPVYIVLLSMVSAIVSESICCLLGHRSLRAVLDGSAAVTGAIIGMVMPAMIPYWMPMLGAAFAIIVAKAPFGGYGRNVFNPAAAGIAILSFCFPKSMFLYPAFATVKVPTDWMLDPATVITESSLAATLRMGATPALTPLQLFTGEFAGPIGATATLILLACAAFLLVRRTASPWLTVPYFVTCILIAWLLPLPGMGRGYGVMAQMCAGYVLFTGVFLLNDPVTAPRFWLGRIFYGIFTAMLVMTLQRIGRVESGCCFAILIMNTLSPIIDRWSWHGLRRAQRLLRIREEVRTR